MSDTRLRADIAVSDTRLRAALNEGVSHQRLCADIAVSDTGGFARTLWCQPPAASRGHCGVSHQRLRAGRCGASHQRLRDVAVSDTLLRADVAVSDTRLRGALNEGIRHRWLRDVTVSDTGGFARTLWCQPPAASCGRYGVRHGGFAAAL
ncbi:MAG: hypothetical protein LBK25_02750 [Treponema sp.]|nr:hypothetical protein [Treponema sp.]